MNVIGTLQVFEAAKALKAKGDRVPPIVYASSAAVFGPDAEYGEKAVGDLDTPDPQSHYGAYKVSSTRQRLRSPLGGIVVGSSEGLQARH